MSFCSNKSIAGLERPSRSVSDGATLMKRPNEEPQAAEDAGTLPIEA